MRREQSRRRGDQRANVAGSDAEAPPVSDPLQRVRAGLDELEPKERLVLTWFYLEEMSVREIAEVLSVPIGTVKSRLFHARSALRAHLEET